MPNNSLFPGFMKVFYSSNGHGHLQILPINNPVEVTAGVWNTTLKNGTAQAFTASVTAYTPFFVALYNTTDSFISAELWTLASPTADPIFRQSVTVANPGTRVTASVPFTQVSITFRTTLGGLFRYLILESPDPANLRDDFPLVAGAFANMAGFLIGGTSFVTGRDGGFLAAGIRLLSKTNDKLREKFLLDT